MSKESLNEPAKLLLLAALLAKDHIISNNAKSFFKELVLRRDNRVTHLLKKFESKEAGDTTFLDNIHTLIEDEAHAVYNELFSETSLEVGKTISKEERDARDLNGEKSLIYGEVDFHSFYRVLRKINPAPGGVFYDLGSGTGKAVFAARFVCDFSRCIGIEILDGLHRQAATIVNRYNEGFQDLLSAGMHQMANVYPGSFLDYDWSDGDVVFANSTCFDDHLMAEMGDMAIGLKPGAIFVTFTKGLNLPRHFEVLERKRYKMSWGPATVFIHRRLQKDGSPVGGFRLNLLPSDDQSYSDAEDDPDKGGAFDEDDDDDDDDDDEESEEDGSFGDKRRRGTESDDNDDDGYEDEYSDDDFEGDDAEDDDEESDDDNEDEDDDDDDTEGLDGEEDADRRGGYAPGRSYVATSQTAGSHSSPLQVKVTPLSKFQQREAAAAPSGMGSPQDTELLKRKSRSAAANRMAHLR